MRHRLAWPAAVAAAVVCAVPSVALGRAATIAPTNFTSNGDLISGWQWLRRPGHTATWTFDITPLAARTARDAHFNMTALVTQRTSGGSGYSALVRLRLNPTPGVPSAAVSVQLDNPFRPIDPDFSSGLGYQAYGNGGIPGSATRGTTLTVTMAYPFSPRGRHVAVKADSLSIGYSVRAVGAPRR